MTDHVNEVTATVFCLCIKCVSFQELGYQGEIGYQTFLYSSVKEWRKLLMFLLEKLPREAVQAADEPTGTQPGRGALLSLEKIQYSSLDFVLQSHC